MKEKILQLCNWDLQMIKRNLPIIKECGWTMIQTSPLQQCKPIWTDNGRIEKYSPEWYDQIHKEFWKLYQPFSFTVGNELGTWEDYICLCEEAHKLGLKICVDVVMRHLSGDEHGNPIPHELCDKGITSRQEFFMNDMRKADNFIDRDGMVNGTLGGLPTLNYENQDLQNNFYLPFLQSLLTYGDGIRIDMAHHFRLPSEGGTFFANVINKLPKDKYISGECNNANDGQLNEYSKYLIPIVHYGQWYGHKNKCSYYENHDTVLSFMLNLTMTREKRLQEWEQSLRESDYALFYARKMDDIIFCNEIKEINSKY